MENSTGQEKKRLAAQRLGQEDWRLWGPYLSERSWGTVREDYSPQGAAWEYFDHDQARSRAYRWNEDGLGGICDDKQRLCLSLALWNGRDPILKERAFGLTGNQGNHGEDVKEYYFYLDALPSHSYLRYLYKYPQAEYPYARLVEEDRRRTRRDPSLGLLDTGIFTENRYWDVEMIYAKADPQTILLRITAHNRGPEAAPLHLLPTLWYRNTWSWGDEEARKPCLLAVRKATGAAWSVRVEHPELGIYLLSGVYPARLLFTENETNRERLWLAPNQTPYVKDAFHRLVVQGEEPAVNPEQSGSKCAAWHILDIPAQSSVSIDLVLAAETKKEKNRPAGGVYPQEPFRDFDTVMEQRRQEADEFYRETLPGATAEDAQIFRQALAGLIWNKQFFHYDVSRWLDGDIVPPPDRKKGRNHTWRHLRAADVINVPDTWEYPWFAAWDLAFHCVAMAQVDIDLAKEQLELLLRNTYLHPNGQLPAYEWSFGDANPPVQAWAALECFRAEREQRGKCDLAFLRRVFNKLVLNYGWWLNRKDPDNRGIFEGGFMGMDNVSVYDRSRPLPPGYSLKQADTSGWMAMLSLNLTVMAIELAQDDPGYEEMAMQFHAQFFAIANAIYGHTESGISLWDEAAAFFQDAMVCPQGSFRLPVFSWVGLIPIFGVEIVGADKLTALPRYMAFLEDHAGGFYDGQFVCACPHEVNEQGEHLFSLAMPSQLPEIMRRVLNPDEFLSPHGIRSLSKLHEKENNSEHMPGIGPAMIKYEPGESEFGLYGGNSNWRGPVWFPLNFIFIRALEKLQRYLTQSFTMPAPLPGQEPFTFARAAETISEGMINIFRRDARGLRPLFPKDSPFQNDPYWRDLLLFREYFHGETGEGLGAAHQTGWTALVANLLQRR